MTLSGVFSHTDPRPASSGFLVVCPKHGDIKNHISFAEAKKLNNEHDTEYHPRSYNRIWE